MDRKIYINPNRPTSSRVYVNKNFARPESDAGQAAPHINPAFRDNFDRNYHAMIEYMNQNRNSNKSRVYVNPKVVNVANLKPEVKPEAKVVAGNKFKKINPPRPPVIGISQCTEKMNTSKHIVVSKSKYQIKKVTMENRKPSTPVKLRTPIKQSKKKIDKRFNSSVLTPRKLITSSPVKFDFVYVGREKFAVLKDSLKRVGSKINNHNTGNKIVKQIKVRGRIFIRKSNSLFVALTKISPKVLKKNNIHCPAFRQSGVCAKHQKGKCKFVHDRKHVRICRKYLNGACKLEGCTLSHDVGSEKMPACKFYLEGCCAKDDCPYSHVKVDENSRICVSFVQGFCAGGENCDKMHVNVCPEFYESNKCNKKDCPYPHRRPHIKKLKIPGEIEDKKKLPVKISENTNSVQAPRYFINVDKDSETAVQTESENVTNRPKIGDLPSFIAL